MRKLIFYFMFIFIFSTLLFSQIPRTVNYQGKITDASGVAIDGGTDIEFRIFDVATGGAPLWTEMHVGVSVNNGLFDVVLGSMAAFPESLDFSAGYYLELAVAGETLEPRQALSAVPYALRAYVAEYGAGGSATIPGDGLYGDSALIHVGAGWGVGVDPDEVRVDSLVLDGRFVNESQQNSVTSSMILDGEVCWLDLCPEVVESIYTGGSASGSDWGRPDVAADLYEGSTRLYEKYYSWGTSWTGPGKGLVCTSSNHFGLEGNTNDLLASGVMGENDLTGAIGRLGAGPYGIHGETSYGSSAGSYGGLFLSTAILDGIGGVGLGNNISTFFVPTNGCGLVGAGNRAGVYGREYTGSGVGYLGYYGQVRTGGPNVSVGVFGQGGLDVGVIGTSTTNDGTRGYTSSSAASAAGVYGVALTPGTETYGVYGETVGTDAAGVYGNGGTNSSGVAGECLDNLGFYAGVLGQNVLGFGVFANGDLGCSGAKPAVVPTSKGWECLYAVEAPDVEYMASGTAVLESGRADIRFERLFKETISPEVPLRIYLTPRGECRQLYVAESSPEGFSVKESFGGESNLEFDWMVIARRKGYEERLENPHLNGFMANVEKFGNKGGSRNESGELNEPDESESKLERLK
ncbi:hypothetical protein JXI42_11200 [bacterium]|nr:hypothetical protein [bacterium]